MRFIARFALIGRNYKLFYERLEPFYGHAIATDLDAEGSAPFRAIWSFSAWSPFVPSFSAPFSTPYSALFSATTIYGHAIATDLDGFCSAPHSNPLQYPLQTLVPPSVALLFYGLAIKTDLGGDGSAPFSTPFSGLFNAPFSAPYSALFSATTVYGHAVATDLYEVCSAPLSAPFRWYSAPFSGTTVLWT